MKFLESAPRFVGPGPPVWPAGEIQGARTPVKERYQDIDDKSEELRDWLESNPRAPEFLSKFEMSWIYHDSALEGTVYQQQELQAALNPGTVAAEASMLPTVWEIRNHKSALDFIR